MSVIKSVLVPVNFSGLAADAYQFSLHLGAELSATVHLLYCVTPPPGVTTHAGMFETILEDLQNSAGQTLAAFREEGIERAKLARPPVVTTSVSVGGLGECMGRTIEQEDVDLVLIGTHGVQNVWDRLFGTNAAFLAKQLEVPLLILPPGTRYRPFRSVCFATDFRDRDLKLATRLNKALFPFYPTFISCTFCIRKRPNQRRGSGSFAGPSNAPVPGWRLLSQRSLTGTLPTEYSATSVRTNTTCWLW